MAAFPKLFPKLMLAALALSLASPAKEMEDWYCGLEDTKEAMPCIHRRMKAIDDPEKRRAMRDEMVAAMKMVGSKSRRREGGATSGYDEMVNRWCAAGTGPGAGSAVCESLGERKKMYGEIGDAPRSPLHEERQRMHSWYCGKPENNHTSSCLHHALRQEPSMSIERRKEVMHLLKAAAKDRMLDATEDAMAEWCKEDLPEGEATRALPDSRLCARWRHRNPKLEL